MSEKISIHKGIVSGNLKDYEQEYQLNFLPEEGELSAKLELALLWKSIEKRYGFRSLRFSNAESFRIMILECLKSLAYFKKAKGELNDTNINLYISNLLTEADRYFREGLKDIK